LRAVIPRINILSSSGLITSATAIRLPTASILWGLPVILTLVAAPDEAILVVTTLAFLVCVALQITHPASALIALPFLALLSPMTGLLDLGAVQLVYSDLFFCILAAQALMASLGRRRHLHPKMSLLLSLLAILFLLSVFVGFTGGYLVSLKPLLYLAQLVVVAYFTAAYSLLFQDWITMIRAWITACFYGAAILLQAYSEGRNLDSLKDMTLVSAEASVDLFSLFRATYYYSGFHYILGLCVVWICVRLFFPISRFERFTMLSALTLILPALVATVNKTAMASAMLAIVITYATLFVRFPRKTLRAMAWFLFWMICLLTVAVWPFGRRYTDWSYHQQNF
jgi:uncharacterized membrane protein